MTLLSPRLRAAAMTFNWQNGLDIALIALILYFLYRSLRAMGTWKIALGVILAAVFFMAADAMELRGVTWIFSQISQIVVLALVIIFQPELRRIFEKAASLRGRHHHSETEQLARILAETAFILSKRRWGGIIVVAGREPLGRWLSNGVAVGGSVSEILLLSIFDPHSPGHDGAVVIENGVMTEMSAKLPLTTSDRLSHLGTRHNASLGLAERSDALVLTISEERGEVSAFLDGEMRRVPDAPIAKALILEHWRESGKLGLIEGGEEKDRGTVVQVAGSIFAALLVWTWVVAPRSEMVERSLEAPVEFLTRSETVLVGEKPSSVTLHLSGNTTAMEGISGEDVRVKIDLSEEPAGKRRIVLSERNVRLPRGLTLLDVEPSSVAVNVSTLVTKEFAVKPRLLGKLPKGKRLKAVTVVPDRVAGIIPSGREPGADPAFLTTTPIELGGVKGDMTIPSQIVAPANIQPAAKRWPDVTVRLDIE